MPVSRGATIATLLWAGLAGACGGRTTTDTPGGTPDAGDDAASAFPPHGPCASADGVRVCGGTNDCPALTPPACPGFGCTAALDVSTEVPSTGGVCWSDLSDQGGTLCAACDDGSVCIQRGTQQLVCVSPHVCEALWDDGVQDVCRYADKSAYNHQALPEPSGPCPVAAGQNWACGGACGACRNGEHCVGRSPSHPFGICTWPPLDPLPDGAPCSIGPSGAADPWCDPQNRTDTSSVCAVFRVSSADESVAMQYGICIPRNPCLAMAASLPGGIDCYDASGNRLD